MLLTSAIAAGFLAGSASGLPQLLPRDSRGDRHGNWTSLSCTDDAVTDVARFSSRERWDRLDATEAWNDAVGDYNMDSQGLSFTQSVSNSLHGPENADCGSLLDTSNCRTSLQCSGFEGKGSGPAAYLIWNSLVFVNEMYSSYNNELYKAMSVKITPSLGEFEDIFAPVKTDGWDELFANLFGLFGTIAISAFANGVMKNMPFFKDNKLSYDNSKDTAKAMVSFSTAMIKEFGDIGKVGDWTREKQNAFSSYLGQVVDATANATSVGLKQLFNGSSTSISALDHLILKGKMVEGSDGNGNIATVPQSVDSTTDQDLQNAVARSFFAFAISAALPLGGNFPFIVDTGEGCSSDPIKKFKSYLSDDMMKNFGGCVDGKQYYLAAVSKSINDDRTCSGSDGGASTCDDPQFLQATGVDKLDGSKFGGITTSNLIHGSVRTYTNNDNKNGAAATDIDNDASFSDLFNLDVTTPGYIRLPVCSAETAYNAWNDGHSDKDHYPCV